MQVKKAKLVFELTHIHADDLPEEEKISAEEDGATLMGATQVTISFEQEGLTANDLFPDDPEKFLENGVLAALCEQIVDGLQSPRGTSWEYASQDAMEKHREAQRILIQGNVLDALEASVLRDAKPQGEC